MANGLLSGPLGYGGAGILASGSPLTPASQAIGRGLLLGQQNLLELEKRKEESALAELERQKVEMALENARRRQEFEARLAQQAPQLASDLVAPGLEGPPTAQQSAQIGLLGTAIQEDPALLGKMLEAQARIAPMRPTNKARDFLLLRNMGLSKRDAMDRVWGGTEPGSTIERALDTLSKADLKVREGGTLTPKEQNDVANAEVIINTETIQRDPASGDILSITRRQAPAYGAGRTPSLETRDFPTEPRTSAGERVRTIRGARQKPETSRSMDIVAQDVQKAIDILDAAGQDPVSRFTTFGPGGKVLAETGGLAELAGIERPTESLELQKLFGSMNFELAPLVTKESGRGISGMEREQLKQMLGGVRWTAGPTDYESGINTVIKYMNNIDRRYEYKVVTDPNSGRRTVLRRTK